MKISLIILVVLIAVFVIASFSMGFMSKSGVASGLVDGKLASCPDKPNCVCSEQDDDASHYIEPIIISQNSGVDVVLFLKSIILEMGGSIEVEDAGYMASTFSSAIFGFVDDLEIRIDLVDKLIHIRSGSRVGHGDAGVNKKRVELLKKLYAEKL